MRFLQATGSPYSLRLQKRALRLRVGAKKQPFLQAIAERISAGWIHLPTDRSRKGRGDLRANLERLPNPSISYEVIRIRRREGFQIGGRFVEPAEVYPNSEAWGMDGFTLPTKKRHLQISANWHETRTGSRRVADIGDELCSRWARGKGRRCLDQNGFRGALRDHAESKRSAFLHDSVSERRWHGSFRQSQESASREVRELGMGHDNGKGKKRASIGFYPRNADGKTCWAALDFDAHGHDNGERALVS